LKIPVCLLRLLPMWSYICPKCRKTIKKNSHKCIHCGEQYGCPVRVPSRVLKDTKSLEEYVHKHVFPRVSNAQRDYLAQYFTEIFSDGFESGDLSEWDGSYADSGCSVVGNDTTYPHHGSYNLKATIAASASNTWALVSQDVSGYNPVHTRAMNCVFENEPDTSDTYRVLAFMQGPYWDALAYAGIKYYNSAWHWWVYARDNGGFVNYYGGTVNFDTAYCMEFSIYRDGSAGYAKLYVDGELEVEATGLNNTDRSLNYATVGFTYSSAGSNPGIFYADCIVIADTYIGPESETCTKTWATDALFKKLNVEKPFAADAAFMKADLVENLALDVAFRKAVIKAFSLDANFLRENQVQRQVDTLFQRLGIVKSAVVDAAFQKSFSNQKQIDAIFKRLDATKTFGLNVYFGSVEPETYAKNFALDVIFAYKVRLPELWLDENGKIVLNVSKPYIWVGN
jgi:hypothetical protein